jgi:hypothetical protein
MIVNGTEAIEPKELRPVFYRCLRFISGMGE